MGILRRNIRLSLQSLESREVPSGNRLFAISEGVGGGRVAVYESLGPTTGPGGSPQFDGAGQLRTTIEPFPGFTGGVRIAVGDVTGDGIEDVVVAAGKGGGPHVKVYDGVNLLQGQARIASEFFAFDARFTGGVFVTVGNFDPQFPGMEIAVGAGEGGGPHVKIFELQPVIFTIVQGAPPPSPYFFANMQNGFFAFDASFRGGVRVAAGDITGDGRAELITAAGPGGGPHVRAFDVNPPNPLALYTYIFRVVDEFYAFNSGFRGGVYVAAGELNGNPATAEVVVGAGEGGGPHVKVFANNLGGRLNQVSETFVGDPADRGGVRVGVGNLSKLTDRQSVYVGTGPREAVTLAIPYVDHRLAGFTLTSNQLLRSNLSLPDSLQSHFRTPLFVGL